VVGLFHGGLLAMPAAPGKSKAREGFAEPVGFVPLTPGTK
jgi:hypothetical protein